MYPTLARLIRTPARGGKPGHFLAEESLYRSVRDLQRGDRVIPLVGDFAGPTSLPRLGDWLRRRGHALGVLYISDVEFFLLRSGRFAAYVEGLGRLPWAEGAVHRSGRVPAPSMAPGRIRGDSSTTVIRPAARFLTEARAGRIKTADDLFVSPR